jgi:opacity protein-like surface antigen
VSRIKLRIPTLHFHSLLAAALLAAAGAAQAQDAPPAPPPAATTGTDTAASASAGQSGGAQAGSSTATASDSTTKAGKSAAVCFKLTGHCVDNGKAGTAPATKSGAAASKDAGVADKSLNLTAPDIRTVVSPEELKEPLPSNDQVTETEEADTVAVKGNGVPADVPMGFGALWWALNHPTQAWRIVAPAD